MKTKQRKTFILTDAMAKDLKEFSEKWQVSEAEALRRLLGLGAFVAEELDSDNELYSVNPKTKERDRLVFKVA